MLPEDKTRRAAIRAGTWVVSGFLLLIVVAIIGARIHTARAGFTIDVTFSFLSNLTRNARVLLSGGRQVGYVKDIFERDQQTYVRLYLDNSLRGRLPQPPDTQIAIFSNNLMGQKYINIQFRELKPGQPVIEPGQVVRGISPPSLEQMMLSFSSWFEGKSVGEVAELIFGKAALLRRNLDDIIAENRDDLEATLAGARNYFTGLSTQLETLKSNLTLLARNSQEILAAEQESLAQLIANTSELAKNLESLEKALAANRGSLGKFHRESKSLRDNIRLTAEYGRSFVRCIRERPWVIIYKESCRQR